MIDVAFLKAWSPARIAIVGALAYAAWVVVSPLNYDFDRLTAEGALFAVCSGIAFLGGCYTVSRFMAPPEAKAGQISSTQLLLTIWTCTVLGSIGVLARAVDRFVLRGQAVTGTFTEVRESLDASLSAYGYIGGGLFSFGMIALMLHWMLPKGYHSRITLLLSIALAAYPVIESVLQGSRSTTFQMMLLLGFCARATGRLGIITRSWITLTITGGAFAFVGLTLYELRALENEYYTDPLTILLLNSISEYAPPNESVVSALLLQGGNSFTSALLRSWIHFSQYFTSTWVIFATNFSSFNGEHGWGALHFGLPLRVLDALLGGQQTYSPYDNGMLEGLWGSSFGWLWYDFGWLAPVTTFVSGILATLIHRGAISRPELWLPPYSLIAVACAFSLVDNQLIGGIGAFATWTFLLYVIIAPVTWVLVVAGRWAVD